MTSSRERWADSDHCLSFNAMIMILIVHALTSLSVTYHSNLEEVQMLTRDLKNVQKRLCCYDLIYNQSRTRSSHTSMIALLFSLLTIVVINLGCEDDDTRIDMPADDLAPIAL